MVNNATFFDYATALLYQILRPPHLGSLKIDVLGHLRCRVKVLFGRMAATIYCMVWICAIPYIDTKRYRSSVGATTQTTRPHRETAILTAVEVAHVGVVTGDASKKIFFSSHISTTRRDMGAAPHGTSPHKTKPNIFHSRESGRLYCTPTTVNTNVFLPSADSIVPLTK
jgi:hypothetical protein